MKTRNWKETSGDKMNVHTSTFTDLAELLDFIATRPEGCVPDDERSSLREGAFQAEWCGTRTMEQTLRLARDGWPEGRELVEAITAKLEGITASKVHRPEVSYAVAGDSVDIGRFLTGEPECMMQWEEVEVETAGKIVRIEANMSASAGITAGQMALRGAAVCALVDALENCGKSVELVLSCATAGRYRRIETFVTVKQAGEPLEMDRLAFMMANASMFRRICFAAWENLPPDWTRGCSINLLGTYGHPAATKGGEFVPDITCPHMLLKGDPQECLRWVFRELKKNGVTLEGV